MFSGKLSDFSHIVLDKEVVLIGDNSDDIAFKVLQNYGAVTDTPSQLISNDTSSKASLTIENFI